MHFPAQRAEVGRVIDREGQCESFDRLGRGGARRRGAGRRRAGRRGLLPGEGGGVFAVGVLAVDQVVVVVVASVAAVFTGAGIFGCADTDRRRVVAAAFVLYADGARLAGHALDLTGRDT